MTFPKFRKNEDLINKSNFGFFSEFICLREKCVFSKIAFQAPSKVHFVRLIFRSRGKFTLLILEFVQIFFIPLRARPFKKNCSALGQRPKLLAAGRPRPPRAHAPRGPGSHSFFLVLVGLFSYFVYSVSNPRSIPNPNLFLVPYPKQNPPLPNINTQAPPL